MVAAGAGQETAGKGRGKRVSTSVNAWMNIRDEAKLAAPRRHAASRSALRLLINGPLNTKRRFRSRTP